ncbi:conserved hypothetical protein, partial [methanotrophic bacterial endosymbiont of Bathymodiolus sp.]
MALKQATMPYAQYSLKGWPDASAQLGTPVLSKESAPIVSKAINQIAARFSIPVSEKLAAQSIPIIGAFGGATINLLFTKVSGFIYSM